MRSWCDRLAKEQHEDALFIRSDGRCASLVLGEYFKRRERVRNIILGLVLVACSVQANEVCSIVGGSKLIAQDGQNTYLGNITNRYSSNSIFNKYGSVTAHPPASGFEVFVTVGERSGMWLSGMVCGWGSLMVTGG